MSIFIDNKADLNKYYQFDDSISVELLDNHLKTVEADYILPILGQTFFDEIANDWNDASIPDDNVLNLIKHIQQAEVELAAWLAIDEFNVSFSAAGLVVTSDRENGLGAASEARTEKLKSSLKRRGFASIDRLIYHLEINVDSFPTWSASAQHDEGLQYFVNTTKEFNKHSSHAISRFIFVKLLPFIKQVEQQSILQTLGQGLFDEIKTQIKDDTLTAPNLILLRSIRPALVQIAFSKAILPLGIHVDGFGISMFNNAFSGSHTARQAPEVVLIEKMMIGAQNDGQWWLNNLSDYLKNNADTYPLYKSGEAYIDVSDDTTQRIGVIKHNNGAIT